MNRDEWDRMKAKGDSFHPIHVTSPCLFIRFLFTLFGVLVQGISRNLQTKEETKGKGICHLFIIPFVSISRA